MTEYIKPAAELRHPGFILFEGIDFVGKSTLAKRIAKEIGNTLGLKVQHNYNQGFLRTDIVDEKVFSRMNPREKAEYFMQCYLKDALPSNPAQFQEIIQDRHAPCIVLYAINMGGMSLEETKKFIEKCIKPKHILLVECDYQERLKRAQERASLKTLEKISIASQEKHEEFISLYRKIIESFEVPFTTIDTTTATSEESVEECLTKITNSGILTYEVSLEDLVVDFECRVYESTVGLREKAILFGKTINPIRVIRKIDSSGKYINTLKDGRHRCYAAWRLGIKTFPAYVNYEQVNKINPSTLTPIKDFKFR